jgi:hypothetical protein
MTAASITCCVDFVEHDRDLCVYKLNVIKAKQELTDYFVLVRYPCVETDLTYQYNSNNYRIVSRSIHFQTHIDHP